MPYYPERPPESHSPEEMKKEQTEKRNRLLRLFLLALAGCAVIYGAVRLIGYFVELSASQDTARELRAARDESQEDTEQIDFQTDENELHADATDELTSTDIADAEPDNTGSDESASDEFPDSGKGIPDVLPSISYPDNPELRISDRFLKLRRKSEYIIGWLLVDELDEAVVQKDNTFFLTHDAMGKKNGNGAIFLDEEASLRYRPYTLYLYGHNMKTGNMFGRLKKYKESAYFYQHQVITFDTMYEEGKYAVFSVLEIDTTPGSIRWYDLYSLDTRDSKSRAEAIQTLEKRSLVGCALDVQADDQLLLLVTCLDGNTERLVVAARRLREGETETGLILRHGQ